MLRFFSISPSHGDISVLGIPFQLEARFKITLVKNRHSHTDTGEGMTEGVDSKGLVDTGQGKAIARMIAGPGGWKGVFWGSSKTRPWSQWPASFAI